LSLSIREASSVAEKLGESRPDKSILNSPDLFTRIDIADPGSILAGGPSVPSGQDAEVRFAGEAQIQGVEVRFRGEVQLNEYIKQGYDIVLIAGVAGIGKSQLIDAFEEHVQPPVLDPFIEGKGKLGGMAQATAPNTIKVYPIEGGLAGHARKILLVNASGEDFAALYPYRRRDKITKEDLKLPGLVKDKLRGLILMVDLKTYWELSTDDEDKKNQIKILTWILAVFRWLINDGAFPDNTTLSLQDYIVARIREMKPKLNIPVLVLFSKADELHSFEIPERQGINSKRVLYPRLETPFFWPTTSCGGFMRLCSSTPSTSVMIFFTRLSPRHWFRLILMK
jgi:hypothetical protein